MINVLIIDKDKNTIIVNLWDNEFKEIFKDKIDFKKVKKHKTISELNKEVSNYLKEMKEGK